MKHILNLFDVPNKARLVFEYDKETKYKDTDAIFKLKDLTIHHKDEVHYYKGFRSLKEAQPYVCGMRFYMVNFDKHSYFSGDMINYFAYVLVRRV